MSIIPCKHLLTNDCNFFPANFQRKTIQLFVLTHYSPTWTAWNHNFTEYSAHKLGQLSRNSWTDFITKEL
jgi:hypothetical protein